MLRERSDALDCAYLSFLKLSSTEKFQDDHDLGKTKYTLTAAYAIFGNYQKENPGVSKVGPTSETDSR